MSSFFGLLASILIQKALGNSCSIGSNYNLTFYVSSSTSDTLTCNGNSPKNAVITDYSINGPPKLTSIWDTKTSNSNYHCLLTKEFYFPGRLSSAFIDVFTDDYTSMKINNKEVSEIPYTKHLFLHKNISVIPYINPGLNTLYIDANNTGGKGYFGYRLIITTYLI